MDNADLAALLENNFLSIVRTVSLFFVAGIALFNFTNLGKNFSIISLIIALVLLFTIVVDYFIERHRISQLGFYPRSVIDIMAFALIGLICLLIWIIYTVWHTSQVSLTELAREVETEIDLTNQRLVDNVKELENKIVDTNRDLIEAIRNLNNPSTIVDPNYVQKYESDVPLINKIKVNRQRSALALGQAAERQSNTVNNAMLAVAI